MKYNVLVLIHGHHSVAPGSLSNADVKWFLYLEEVGAGVVVLQGWRVRVREGVGGCSLPEKPAWFSSSIFFSFQF